VPFVFDIHAIIYSDDAPALDRALHREFDPIRINAQNYREEFFRARLEDVGTAVARWRLTHHSSGMLKRKTTEKLSQGGRNAALLALDAVHDARPPEAI
jgi:hypothetical protein